MEPDGKMKPMFDHEESRRLFEREDREARLMTYAGPDRVVSSTEMRRLLAAQNRKVYSFSTGLHRLDDAVGKIETGELIAIGGPTKHGKTTLAQTLTVNLASSGARCLWFTFEVPVHQFLQQIPEVGTFYLPMEHKAHDFSWTVDRIGESSLKHGTQIVFIDNLHHLFDLAKTKNASLDIGHCIRSLKRMAIEADVAIFLLCHSKKPAENRGEVQEASEWDLRDSSFIPQESDSTWMIQRKMDKNTGEFRQEALLKICNHRRTGVMAKKIHLVRVGALLEEDLRHYELSESF